MKGTSQISSGGRVEHEIFLWQNVIVMLFEVKHTLGAGKQLDDCVAQVMGEKLALCVFTDNLVCHKY
jgi:hypothetical protein